MSDAPEVTDWNPDDPANGSVDLNEQMQRMIDTMEERARRPASEVLAEMRERENTLYLPRSVVQAHPVLGLLEGNPVTCRPDLEHKLQEAYKRIIEASQIDRPASYAGTFIDEAEQDSNIRSLVEANKPKAIPPDEASATLFDALTGEE